MRTKNHRWRWRLVFLFKNYLWVFSFLIFSLFLPKAFCSGKLNTLLLAMCSVKRIWENILLYYKKTDKYSHICFVGDNTEHLYCKTSCFAERSPSAETCVLVHLSERTINHQVVIGIVWESSVQLQEERGRRAAFLPACHSLSVPLLPYAHYFIILPHSGLLNLP